MNIEITPEVVEALRTLRSHARYSYDVGTAFDTLDNAGIFSAIDEATSYDVDPEPERVSKCTCPGGTRPGQKHLTGCPGDPAEYGDLAFTTAMAEQNMRLTAEHTAKLAERRAKAREAKKATTARWQRAVGLSTAPPAKRECPSEYCTGAFAVNRDGALRSHTNDMCEPCSQGR